MRTLCDRMWDTVNALLREGEQRLAGKTIEFGPNECWVDAVGIDNKTFYVKKVVFPKDQNEQVQFWLYDCEEHIKYFPCEFEGGYIIDEAIDDSREVMRVYDECLNKAALGESEEEVTNEANEVMLAKLAKADGEIVLDAEGPVPWKLNGQMVEISSLFLVPEDPASYALYVNPIIEGSALVSKGYAAINRFEDPEKLTQVLLAVIKAQEQLRLIREGKAEPDYHEAELREIARQASMDPRTNAPSIDAFDLMYGENQH